MFRKMPKPTFHEPVNKFEHERSERDQPVTLRIWLRDQHNVGNLPSRGKRRLPQHMAIKIHQEGKS